MNEDQEVTNTEDPGPSRLERLKDHLKENKRVYAAAVGGVVAGGTVVGAIMLRYAGFQLPEIQQNAKNTALIIWKPTTTQVALVREACPDPIPVLDKLTGESYRSLNRAAKATGTTVRKISEDAQGVQERFERLPESVFA